MSLHIRYNESDVRPVLPGRRSPRPGLFFKRGTREPFRVHQGACGAVKDNANPFFKSKYADLSSVWEACREALVDHGLAVIQTASTNEHGASVETMLCHSSGEWVSETLTLPLAKHDAQGIGSALTYARRYGLSAIVGVAPEDDDGEGAAEPMRKLRDLALKTLNQARSAEDLEAAWKSLTLEGRKACKDDLPGLKAKFHRETQPA